MNFLPNKGVGEGRAAATTAATPIKSSAILVSAPPHSAATTD